MYEPARLPAKLKAGRDYRNYSQQGMADDLDVHVSSYNKWELGKNEPNAIVVARIANILHLDIGFFFCDMDAKDADLNYRDERKELDRLAEEVKQFRTYVEGGKGNDPVVAALRTNRLLYQFCNRLRSVDEMKLQRIIDKMHGYLDGIEESQRGDLPASSA